MSGARKADMPYRIKRHDRIVESHSTLAEATRAFWILTAHELSNGRTADYTLDTNGCDSVEMLPRAGLPGWVADELAKHDLLIDE
jgi:hypothetical protein